MGLKKKFNFYNLKNVWQLWLHESTQNLKFNSELMLDPAKKLFEVNNRNNRKMWKICSKSATLKILGRLLNNNN